MKKELIPEAQRAVISNTVFNEKAKEDLNYDGWAKHLAYYRHYVDRFCVDCLEMNHLYPFQRLMLRAMATHNNSMIIATRGRVMPQLYGNI